LPYRVIYAPPAERHLRSLTARQRATVLDAVEQQLVHEPGVQTRNRKRLLPNPLAPWELRIGDLRVYYDIRESPESVVSIQAVGIKKRNRVYIAGKAVEP
jgi:mRNA-degrading endonuclease RelE of RelBE toxin-antitoxin system